MSAVQDIFEGIIRGELVVALMLAVVCMGVWLGRGPR